MRFTIVNRGDERFANWLMMDLIRCDYFQKKKKIAVSLYFVDGLGKLRPRYWFCSEACVNTWVLQNLEYCNDKTSY